MVMVARPSRPRLFAMCLAATNKNKNATEKKSPFYFVEKVIFLPHDSCMSQGLNLEMSITMAEVSYTSSQQNELN